MKISGTDSLYQVLKLHKTNILQSIVIMFVINLIGLLILSALSTNLILIYIFSGIIVALLIFFMAMFIFFSLKDPDRLHSESHRTEMATLALGSNSAYREAMRSPVQSENTLLVGSTSTSSQISKND